MITVNRKKVEVTDIPVLWRDIRRWITDHQATDAEITLAEQTLSDWVKTPDKHAFGNAYRKDVDDLDELARALLGNVRAAGSRRAEEVLAWLVIGNVHSYEEIILDPLITFINRLTEGNEELRSLRNLYGPRVQSITYSGKQWSVTEFTGENHEVLYLKVAFINTFALSFIMLYKLRIPGRSQSDTMRKKDSKGSLVETHPLVESDRSAGVSVWAGTSGSTMDIIYFARNVAGITDSRRLTCLAWCAFAFFQILPTVRNATHTFHEVMRGAKHVAPNIDYDPANTALPPVDPLTRDPVILRAKL